jgi:hypothetical protein
MMVLSFVWHTFLGALGAVFSVGFAYGAGLGADGIFELGNFSYQAKKNTT